MHGPDVVLSLEALDLEPAVLALAGQAVLEDHHGRHDVLALEVGDVEALDPQRRRVEAESLGDLLQGARAGRQVAGALGLVQGEGLLGIALDRLHQVLLVSALGDAQRDVRATALAEPLADRAGVLGQRRDEDFLGDRVALLLAVQLLKRVLDEADGCRRPRPCR